MSGTIASVVYLGSETRYHVALDAGGELIVRGPKGRFVFDPETHREPLVLLAAGSGITPAMSILRTIHDLQLEVPVTLLYGCRTAADVIFGRVTKVPLPL